MRGAQGRTARVESRQALSEGAAKNPSHCFLMRIFVPGRTLSGRRQNFGHKKIPDAEAPG